MFKLLTDVSHFKKDVQCVAALQLYWVPIFFAYGWHRRLGAGTALRFMGPSLKAALRQKLHKIGCKPELKKVTFKKLQRSDTYTYVRKISYLLVLAAHS